MTLSHFYFNIPCIKEIQDDFIFQENNAIAEIDIEAETIRNIYPLGWKDWLRSGLDASDRDGGKTDSV